MPVPRIGEVEGDRGFPASGAASDALCVFLELGSAVTLGSRAAMHYLDSDRSRKGHMSVTKQAVIEKLKTVNGPDFSGNIVDLGLVSEIFIADSKVFFSITVPAARANDLEPLRAAAERAVKSMP